MFRAYKKPIKRSKEGCVTCKARKVKCDLEKPVCKQCRGGRKPRECVWDKAHPWVFDPAKRPAETASQEEGLTAEDKELQPLHVIATRPQASRRGLEAFQYYVECVAPANSELQGGTDFWKKLAFWHDAEPSLMHLLQAYGTLNRAWWNNHDVSLRVFFFESLSNGLQHFHRRSRLFQDEIFVFTALLLAALEELRAMDVKASKCHVEAAMQIIDGWPQDDNEWPLHTRSLRDFLRSWIRPGMEITMMKIGMAENGFSASPTVPKGLPSLGGLAFGNATAFLNAMDAAGELQEIIFFWVCPLVVGQRHAWVGILDPKLVRSLLDTFYESFVQLESKHPVPVSEIASRKLVRANYLAARTAVACACAQWTVVSQNVHAEKFGEILHVMETFLEHGLDQDQLAFAGLLVDPIAPLYFVATCARERSVKNKALSMLKHCHGAFGMWTAHVAYLIASTVANFQRHSEAHLAYAASGPLPWYQACRVTAETDDEKNVTEMCVLLYDIGRSEKFEQVCTVSLTGDDSLACQQIDWPLHALIRSLGFYKANRFPTPLMQTTPRALRHTLSV